MRGRKNPPLDLLPVPEGAPVTFDTMAIGYLQDYQLQRYRSLTTARARVEHLRGFFGGLPAEGNDCRSGSRVPTRSAETGV